MNESKGKRNPRWLLWLALGMLTAALAFLAGAVVGAPEGVPAGPDPVNQGLPAFVDVDPGEPAVAAIAAAWQYGYMVGIGGDTFNPQGPVTRGQVAVVLVRCALGADFEPEPVGVPEPGHPYAYWAVPWLAEAVDLGFMEPTAIVAGERPMTRADLAAMLATCGPLADLE